MTAEPMPTQHIVERWVGRALRAGVWISAGLILIGLAFAWISGSPLRLPAENPKPDEVFRSLVAGTLDPITLIFAGLLLLMLTPFLRVLTAAIGFAVEKDHPFVIVALVVFSMLLAELIFSLH